MLPTCPVSQSGKLPRSPADKRSARRNDGNVSGLNHVAPLSVFFPGPRGTHALGHSPCLAAPARFFAATTAGSRVTVGVFARGQGCGRRKSRFCLTSRRLLFDYVPCMVLNASTLTPGVERAIPDTRFQALGRVPDERPSACVRAVDAALAVPKLIVLAARIGGPFGRVLVRGEAFVELFCRLEISTLTISKGFGALALHFASTDHRRCVPPGGRHHRAPARSSTPSSTTARRPDTRRAASAETGGWSPRPSAAASGLCSRRLRSVRATGVQTVSPERQVAAESTVDRV